MKKGILLILLSISIQLSAQTNFSETFNFTKNSYSTPIINTQHLVPRGVGFDVMNGNLLLNDTSLADYTDSLRFGLSSIVNDSLYIKKITYPVGSNNPDYGDYGFNCSMTNSQSTTLDSVILQLNIAPLNTFTNLNINYQGKWYAISKPTNSTIDYLQWDEADVIFLEEIWSSVNPCVGTPLFSQVNGQLLMDFNLKKGGGSVDFLDISERVNDTVSMHFYSTHCSGHLANVDECVQVNIADWNSFTTLDINIYSTSDIVPNVNGWFRVEKTSNNQLTWTPSAAAFDFQTVVAINEFELRINTYENYNQLTWSVDNVKEVQYFEILSKEEQGIFKTIETVSAVANQLQYNFQDDSPASYGSYKIRAHYFDSDFVESNTAAFSTYKIGRVSLQPNPSKGEVSISGLESAEYKLTICSSDGKVVLSKTINPNQNTQKIDISTLAHGMYIFNLEDVQFGKTETFKVIKN